MAHRDLDRAFGTKSDRSDSEIVKHMSNAPASARWVYVCLCNCRNEKNGGLCCPTIDDLMTLTGYSKRGVQEALKILASFDLIQVYVIDTGRHRKNYYALAGRKSNIPPTAEKVEYGSQKLRDRYGKRRRSHTESSRTETSHTETSTGALTVSIGARF